MARPRSQPRGDATARALLEAARAEFARRGFAGASVRTIARRARANPALVRYHFGSKAGLHAKVLEVALGRLRERLVGALLAETTLAGRARAVVSAYLDHLAADRDLPRLIQRALLDRDRRGLAAVLAGLAPLVAAARFAAAAPPPPGVEDAALSLFGAAIAPFLYAPLVSGLLGIDVEAPAFIARRRRHLEALVDALAEDLLP